mmetsp:Transcript_30143/g.29637  ORF Transcript_30143/g.29637 Transcript_30143/m.29637 type:complete len:83 (-) Transcript_30143:160-408(-)
MSKNKSKVKVPQKTYPTGPDFKGKFRPGEALVKVKEIVDSKLEGASYTQDKLSLWNTEICNDIRHELKGLAKDRYKYVVQAW